MDVQIGPITAEGFVDADNPVDAINTVLESLRKVVYRSDEYTTGNLGMSRVKITIEVM